LSMEDRPSRAHSEHELAEFRRRRRRMRLALRGQGAEGLWPAREVRPADAEALGRLMHDAYRGTVDDDGETLDQSVAEARDTLSGKHGQILSRCSFVIEDGSHPICATLVTLWGSRPLLAFVMTHPDHKGQGMATFLVKRTIDSLVEQGHQELDLLVTRTNEPAVRIYERLGFHDVEG
jgi:ribosomal protein S18 acetylase RimI-like enzyme